MFVSANATLWKVKTGEFENEINNPPNPDEWINTKIEVTKDSVKVLVNHKKQASLTVKDYQNKNLIK